MLTLVVVGVVLWLGHFSFLYALTEEDIHCVTVSFPDEKDKDTTIPYLPTCSKMLYTLVILFRILLIRSVTATVTSRSRHVSGCWTRSSCAMEPFFYARGVFRASWLVRTMCRYWVRSLRPFSTNSNTPAGYDEALQVEETMEVVEVRQQSSAKLFAKL